MISYDIYIRAMVWSSFNLFDTLHLLLSYTKVYSGTLLQVTIYICDPAGPTVGREWARPTTAHSAPWREQGGASGGAIWCPMSQERAGEVAAEHARSS